MITKNTEENDEYNNKLSKIDDEIISWKKLIQRDISIVSDYVTGSRKDIVKDLEKEKRKIITQKPIIKVTCSYPNDDGREYPLIK